MSLHPWSEFEPQRYRFADFAAYFRKAKRACAQRRSAETPGKPIPIRSSIATSAGGGDAATSAAATTIIFASLPASPRSRSMS